MFQTRERVYIPQEPGHELRAIRTEATFLDGIAAKWGMGLHACPSTWAAFDAEVRQNFIPTDVDRVARERLDGLRQRGDVAQYVKHFRGLMIDVPDVNPTEAYWNFVEGLDFDIRREIYKANITNIEDDVLAGFPSVQYQ